MERMFLKRKFLFFATIVTKIGSFRIVAGLILLAFIGLSGSVFAQQTVEKKSYYDYWQTKIKQIWHETGDGKWHGSSKTFFESGKLHSEVIYDLDKITSHKTWDKAGNLLSHTNKNTNGQFNGEQRTWVLISGKPVMFQYAKVNNGDVIEYKSGINTHYINNTYKEYDDNEKVHFSIINGKANGKIFFNTESNNITYTHNPNDYYVEIIDNKITEINKNNKQTDYFIKILPDNKTFYFYYKNKQGGNYQEGYYKLKDDLSNDVGYSGVSLRAHGWDNMEFTLDINYSGCKIDYCVDAQKFRDKVVTMDSVWRVFNYNGVKTSEEIFRNGEKVTGESYYDNGKIKYEETLSNGKVIDYTRYDENGNITASSKEDKAKQEIENAKKREIQKQDSLAKVHKVLAESWPGKRGALYKRLGKTAGTIRGVFGVIESQFQKELLAFYDAPNRYSVNTTDTYSTEIRNNLLGKKEARAVMAKHVQFYQAMFDVINKIDLETFKKDYKKIKTIEQLQNYLNTIK